MVFTSFTRLVSGKLLEFSAWITHTLYCFIYTLVEEKYIDTIEGQ